MVESIKAFQVMIPLEISPPRGAMRSTRVVLRDNDVGQGRVHLLYILDGCVGFQLV